MLNGQLKMKQKHFLIQDKIINIVIAAITAIVVLVSYFLLLIKSSVKDGSQLYSDHGHRGNLIERFEPSQMLQSLW